MAHVYLDLRTFQNGMRDGGETKFGDETKQPMLDILEAVARRIDVYAERWRGGTGTGFGPRIGTNRYEHPGCNTLELDDDLLSITSVTTYDTYGTLAATLVDGTDFIKHGPNGYDAPPYRQLILLDTSNAAWGSAIAGNVVTGTWGERDERRTITATLAENLDTSETEVDVSAITELSPGHTIRIDDEQMYVRATTDSTTDSVTVGRAVNGTTAAAHTSGAAIQVYRYHPDVVAAQRMLSQKGWKARDAGNTAGYGGGPNVPITVPNDSEWSILSAQIGGLCYRTAG